jgi:prepilin-type N-terminal cleavage/methylation domain-containing protein
VRAFTLIELLIVVAIIAILAAIAVPNFMEAQTRAKVSRAKTDMRTIAVALESYCVDNNEYPYPISPYKESLSIVHELTTPVSYLSSVALLDAFPPKFEDLDPPPPPGYLPTYFYDNYSGAFSTGNPVFERHKFTGFCLASVGPNRKWDAVVLLPLFIGTEDERKYLRLLYDPTNGTGSSGDIGRWTGKPTISGGF